LKREGFDCCKAAIVLVTTPQRELDEEGRSNWKNSRLSAHKGDLDVVELLKEFHVMMIANYGKFVAETFFPELVPVAEFYGNLSKEAQRALAGSSMIFVNDIDESNFLILHSTLS
jgi:hypothetical protein